MLPHQVCGNGTPCTWPELPDCHTLVSDQKKGLQEENASPGAATTFQCNSPFPESKGMDQRTCLILLILCSGRDAQAALFKITEAIATGFGQRLGGGELS